MVGKIGRRSCSFPHPKTDFAHPTELKISSRTDSEQDQEHEQEKRVSSYPVFPIALSTLKCRSVCSDRFSGQGDKSPTTNGEQSVNSSLIRHYNKTEYFTIPVKTKIVSRCRQKKINPMFLILKLSAAKRCRKTARIPFERGPREFEKRFKPDDSPDRCL